MATRGRPPKYKPEYVDLAENICKTFGADNEKLAEFFKVAVSSVNLWKEKHSDFSDAIKRGKDFFDCNNVEKSLLQNALGYDYEETTYERIEVGLTPEDVRLADETGALPRALGTKVRTVKKHMPGVVTAQIYWTKNRNPARWRDAKDIDFREPDRPRLSPEQEALRERHARAYVDDLLEQERVKRGPGDCSS